MVRATLIVIAALLYASSTSAAIVIGVAVPSTGPKAELGALIRSTAEAVIAAHHAHEPTAGEPVVLHLVDDGCSAEGGGAAARELVAANVAFVVGHPCSNAAVAAARIYAAAGIALIATGPRHPDLTVKRAGPTIFRLGGRDDREAADTVAILAPIVIGQRVAIVEDRTVYARVLSTGVAEGLRARGVTDIRIEPIVAGERDYDAVIGRLKAAGVEAVYFAGFPTEANLIFDGLRAAGVTARHIGCSALAGVRRPGLSVMAPRMLDRETIAAGIERALTAAIEAADGAPPVADALANDGFDANGDDTAPSYVSSPFPLE